MPARYFVLGSPIAHSLSPVLHRAAFRAEGRDATYEAVDVGKEDLLRVLAELAPAGVNLTSPLKEKAIDACAKFTWEAAASGAVNTIRFSPEEALGHNTDGAGFVTFLERQGIVLTGARVVFLGGGGAVRGIAHALYGRKVATMTAIVRSKRERIHYVDFALDASPLRDANLVIRALPAAAGPLFADRVPPQAVAIDLGYHPATTPWLAAVRARGVKAANGLGMLIEQALLAQEFWHGTMPPRSALEEAVGWSDPFTA